MATTMTPPASSAPPNMSNFDQIGAALSEPAASEPSQAEETIPEAPAETQPESTPDIPATEPDATSDVDADATASADQQQEEPNPYDQPDGEVPKQTLDVLLQTPRGKEIYQGYKALKEFSKPIDQGGLGFVPTVEQAREHYFSHRDRVLMESDINSGNPQQAERLIAHLLNPQRGEGSQVFASRIAPALAKMAQEAESQNPALAQAYRQAYTSAAQPFLATYSTALWDRWTEMPDGPAGSEQARAKAAIGYAAQVLEHDLTGKYRDPGKPAEGQAQQQGPDPLAEERAQLEAREAHLNRVQQQTQQAELQRMSQGINAKIGSALTAEFDKALAPLKKLYEKTPKRYDRAVKAFNEDVMQEVPKNQHAWEILQTQYRDAVRTRNPQAIETVAREYVRLATPVIQAKRKAFLEEEGAVVQQQSDAQHATLRSAASHGAPNGGGGGTRNPSPITPLTRQPGESQPDFNLRLIRGT